MDVKHSNVNFWSVQVLVYLSVLCPRPLSPNKDKKTLKAIGTFIKVNPSLIEYSMLFQEDGEDNIQSENKVLVKTFHRALSQDATYQ